MQFAYQSQLKKKKGQVPVLLVMDVDHDDGDDKAFLYDSRCSAFPDEKEYLLGGATWQVTKVAEETLEYSGKEFKGYKIYLV